MQAIPNICKIGPPISTVSVLNKKDNTGLLSTERPTPAGIASNAVIRSTDSILRFVPAISLRAHDAVTFGSALFPKATQREGTKLNRDNTATE